MSFDVKGVVAPGLAAWALGSEKGQLPMRRLALRLRDVAVGDQFLYTAARRVL